MSGHRCGLTGHTLHHVAVSAQNVDVVVKEVEAWPIEMAGSPMRGDGHADTGGHTLPQRAGGRLDTRGPAVLGMTWASAVELSKASDVFQRHGLLTDYFVLGIHRLDAGEVQQRVEKH